MDRRALIVGNWQSISHNGLSSSRVKSLVEKLQSLFDKSGQYPFGSLSDPARGPDVLLNPAMADLVKLVSDDASGINEDSLLMFYYIGNSRPHLDKDISIILRKDEKTGREATISISSLLEQVSQSGFKNLVLVLDSCHAGRAISTIKGFPGRLYAMIASGDGYVFNADFSDRLITVLDRPPHKNDHRVDRSMKGVTLEKAFQVATGQLRNLKRIENYNRQSPSAYGELAKLVIREAELKPSNGYNVFAGDRTVYGRTFWILRMLRDVSMTPDQLVDRARQNRIFLISEDSGPSKSPKYIDRQTILRYVGFLIKARLVVSPRNVLTLTDAGLRGSDQDQYNSVLLSSIENNILPQSISINELERVVSDLLSDMIQPSPRNIQERFQMGGIDIPMSDELRFGLRLLPSTGRFLKGSPEAIFPSDPV